MPTTVHARAEDAGHDDALVNGDPALFPMPSHLIPTEASLLQGNASRWETWESSFSLSRVRK
jgi:hypothetical protein